MWSVWMMYCRFSQSKHLSAWFRHLTCSHSICSLRILLSLGLHSAATQHQCPTRQLTHFLPMHLKNNPTHRRCPLSVALTHVKFQFFRLCLFIITAIAWAFWEQQIQFFLHVVWNRKVLFFWHRCKDYITTHPHFVCISTQGLWIYWNLNRLSRKSAALWTYQYWFEIHR